MEGAIDGEGGHVFNQVECVGHVGGVENKVKRKSPGFGPVFVLSADEFFGSKGEGVVTFGGGV